MLLFGGVVIAIPAVAGAGGNGAVGVATFAFLMPAHNSSNLIPLRTRDGRDDHALGGRQAEQLTLIWMLHRLADRIGLDGGRTKSKPAIPTAISSKASA